MRFINMSSSDLPDGWAQRAQRALGELRREVEQAAETARLEGGDVRAARRKAVKSGLKVQSRVDVWRSLRQTLATRGYGKCWYSESRDPTADKNVDHFRPKGRVAEDPSHEGYWWLAFEWRNLRYASQWCNQRRNDTFNATSGGKGDQFPLLVAGSRAYSETDDCTLEDVELLDPADPDDWRLLTFVPTGMPLPVSPKGTREHRRAATSIKVYHLHGVELVRARQCIAQQIKLIVEDLETLRVRLSKDRFLRRFYLRRIVELRSRIQESATFSAAALAYARAEVYTIQHGQQVKRQWLESLLLAVP